MHVLGNSCRSLHAANTEQGYNFYKKTVFLDTQCPSSKPNICNFLTLLWSQQTLGKYVACSVNR